MFDKAEKFELLKAVGLLHPTMTPWDLDRYGLAVTVHQNPTLLAAVEAAEGPLEDYMDSADGSVEYYTVEAYADAFKAMPAAQQQEIKKQILDCDGWARWAASKE